MADREEKKQKRCLGTLYYSQARLNANKQPVCAGLKSKMDKPLEGLSKETIPSGDFKYMCLGYSVYDADRGSQPSSPGNVELPYCQGLEVISAAELLKTPAVLNEGAAGASVSSREPTSRAPQQSHPAQQQPGRSFVPGGGSGFTGASFSDSFLKASKRIADRMGNNMSFIAKGVKDTLDRVWSGGSND